MKRFSVQRGNNMPVQSPLIPDPFVPYHCPGNRTVFALCRGDRRVIDRYLKHTPFKSAGDLYIVQVSDFSNCDKVAFMDAAIVLPITFRARPGGYYFFEYENDDRAIAAGRDLWGYPKKYADIGLARNGKVVTAAAVRHGTTIMEVAVDLSKPVDLPKLKLTPHFNMHVLPRGDRPGWREMRVIERDTSPDFELHTERFGRAKVKLRSLPGDPLGEFQPREVLGGSFIVGDFHATTKNGWGRTIATFRPGATFKPKR